MSILRDFYKRFTSWLKRRSSPQTNTPSSSINSAPDVHQVQQQQSRDDYSCNVDLEAAREFKPQCELDGFLGIAELQKSDAAYRIAPEMTDIGSYVTQKRTLRLKGTWRDVKSAITSGNKCLEEELFPSLASLYDVYNNSICQQNQINQLERPSKRITKKYITQLRKKLGADAENIEHDPSCYISYDHRDMPEDAARRLLEFPWVQRMLQKFQDKSEDEHSYYLHFPDEVIFAIKTSMMLFIVMVYVYMPVVIPVLGVVNSPTGIITLYAAFISLSCIATTSTLDVKTALAVQLAYAAVLGNVFIQKDTA